MVTGIVEGLSGIKEYYAEQERRKEAAQAAKATWFKLAPGESANVVFLQELDESAPGYRSDRGLGFLAVEHTNPEDWHKRALCTAGDGEPCFGCEMNQRGWESNNGKDKDDPTRYKGGWKARRKLYVNVLVMKAGEEPFVAILSQGDSAKMITGSLLEVAVEDGSITNQVFKIGRKGEGFDTSYSLLPRPKETVPDTNEYDVYDLSKAVRSVEYEDQPSHYGVVLGTEPEPKSNQSDDEELSW